VVQAIEARLKELIGQMCQEHQAEVEELEVLPHHVHLLGSRDPQFGMHRLVKLIKGRSSGEQCAELPGCREVRPELVCVPSQVLQDVVTRVDLAFDAFFRRSEQGEKPGYPRFKCRFRYHSLTFKQYGNSFHVLAGNKKNRGTLVLAKLGHVKMVMHQAIKGTPKTAIVKRTPTGKWFVAISVELAEQEVQEKRLPPSEEAVGIDVGLHTFAYLSTGEEIANPRFFRRDAAALARAQRKLAKAPKRSKRRAKKRKVGAHIHERIANRRKTFIEQAVRQLIQRFGFIAVEALVVRNLIKNPKLAKSIADVSWSKFFTRMLAKAEEAGRQVVRVNPAYTSQTCSACGHRQTLPLSVRVYECLHCGLVIHRDHNGSLNILTDAFHAVGRHSRVIPAAVGSFGTYLGTRAQSTSAPAPDCCGLLGLCLASSNLVSTDV
jgi:putative transposase